MNTKNQKKRVIFFLPKFSQGGASESIVKLSKFLSKNNYSVLLISIGKNSYKTYLKKIKCKVLELSSSRTLFSILELRKIIKKDLNNYLKTILISNIHYANVISLISCFKLKDLKIILTERSSISELLIYTNFLNFIKKKIIYLLAKILYRFADLVITNSKFEKKYIKDNFNIKNIDFIYPPSILSVKKKYKIPKNNKIVKIIYVGRLSKEKGVITILKALLKIKNKVNFVFEIYGEGYEKEVIKKFIKFNNLNKNVKLMGFHKNNKNIFSNANLFINASWFEGLPNALVQSINNGIFPIVSRSPGGNNEVIKFGKLGLSFKSGDSEDLKNKILFFQKNKIKLNEKIRVNHINNFTESKLKKKYLKILNNFF